MRALATLTSARAAWVVAVVVAALIAAAIPASGVFEATEPFDISDPNSEVERAYRAFEAASGHRPEAEVALIVTIPGPADSPEGEAAIAATERALAEIPGVAMVLGPQAREGLVSSDRRRALVAGFLEAGEGRVEVGERVAAAFAGDEHVLAGGTAVAAYELGEESERDARRIELLAAPVLLLLCLIVFRTLVAAVLPLAVATTSILLSLALLRALAEVVDIDLFSLQVVTGLGIGLAIDYSLFIVARYRSERTAGASPSQVHRRTLATAGRTVAFSSATVTAAIAALILFDNQFLRSTGIAGGLVVLLCGVTALVLLPAVLWLLGPRLERGAIDGAGRSLGRADQPPPRWIALTATVLRRPVPVATLALLAVLAIASPALDVELTTPDARVLPSDRSARQVADAVLTEFPELRTTALNVVVPRSGGGGSEEATRRVERHPDVDRIEPFRQLDEGTGTLVVLSPLDPLSDEAQDLVGSVRQAPWPEGSLVGGRAAELVDQRQSISERVPLVVAVVVLTNLLLVVTMLRSLPLPLLAVSLNLLTVAASLGITVAVFRSEALTSLIGAVPQQGIDISVPILAFAVVFGLSTDYGIFLMARIAEARARGASDEDAIAAGLVRTGRLITAAAVIFSVAVGAFVFSDLVIVKQTAVAISVAVLLDASLIRCFLLPAAMRLLGPRVWWWPGRAGPRSVAPR